MPSFLSDNVEIYFERRGEGQPIVLVHGFASSGKVNWVSTGWVKTLNEAGYSPIILDNRGHGRSQKLYDPALYPARTMAGDVSALISYLGLGAVPIMGYSMGARISAFVALDHPELVNGVIFGGLGINMVRGLGDSQNIVDGLLAASIDDVEAGAGRDFRRFAERTGSDLKALAACMSASRDRITAEQLGQLQMPVLVAVGSDDEIGGDPKQLADLMPRGQSVVIPDKDHMRATGDAFYKQATLEFLTKLST